MNMKGICTVVAERIAREYNAGYGKSLVLPEVRERLCREIPALAALTEREATDCIMVAAVLENVSLAPARRPARTHQQEERREIERFRSAIKQYLYGL